MLSPYCQPLLFYYGLVVRHMLARQRGVAEVLVFDLALTPDALVLFVCLLQAVEFMLVRCLHACLCTSSVSSDLPSPTVLYFMFLCWWTEGSSAPAGWISC